MTCYIKDITNEFERAMGPQQRTLAVEVTTRAVSLTIKRALIHFYLTNLSIAAFL